MIRKICIVVLSIPFLIFGIIFDLIKLPILIVLSPILLVMDLIDILKGQGSYFISTMLSLIFMGFTMWADMVDLPIPSWMDS
jgi:hypothetical protein